MVTRSDAGWTARVKRRRVLALPLVFGMAGCSEWAAINDPYIKVMKKDPMFLWEPPTAATRTVIYSPRNGTYEPTGASTIVVWLTPNDPRVVPEVLQAAEDARTQAGYSKRDRRLGGHESSGTSGSSATSAPMATSPAPQGIP